MTVNTIQTTFANAMKSLGLTKKGGAWYLHSDDTVLVVELQKSNFGLTYFVNVAVWLRSLGDSHFPKEHACHIRTRLGELVADPERIAELLDLERSVDDLQRADELEAELTTTLRWVFEATDSLGALSSKAGDRLRDHSLVTGAAQRLIAGEP
ncbi:DUF4304 domain-containing protein [Nocardioides carbamazepini]|uniref:DUF4304 domain-containing protein n=1 Tax=Nocardioides carbamazepini TaxID=2854259 RepID=UPI002149D5D6|nr:DUF4304 domain-containing protein [Nocardioides carbamazepini]MCR1784449.1 DUF4304 domain-containing protein [Nocardioides carbamazepini]